MANFNRVLLMGNLTWDPELRYTPSGKAVTTLGLAVNNRYGKGEDQKEDVLFIDVTVWGKTAENCAEYLGKGSSVFVEGRLKFRTWEHEGQKRSKVDVTAFTVQFLGGGRQGGKPASAEEAGDIPPMEDDDVPF